MDGAAQPPPRLRFADWAAIEEPLLLVPAAGWTARHGTIRLGTDGLHDSPLEEGVSSEPVSESGIYG